MAGLVVLLVTATATPAGGDVRVARRAPRPHATAVHHPDFNHDGYADLVVTAEGDDVGAASQAGAFWVLYGGARGANTGSRHQYFTETSIGRGAASTDTDDFGVSYTTGDFNGDGYDDIAVSAPSKSFSGHVAAGAVVVLYGSIYGLIAGNAQYFTEATSGLNATPQTNDEFGVALAAGDFNHDGRDDLAIGVDGKTINGVPRAGAVFELFGTRGGLSHRSPLLPNEFDETTNGLHGGAKAEDRFGKTLQAADFNGDGFADLAASAPDKSVDGAGSAGVVDVLRGSTNGLTANGAQTWSEDTTGVPDASEPADGWGYTLAAFDLNRDGASDLVVGAPYESLGATNYVGAATVLMGSHHLLTTDGARFYLLSSTTFDQSPEQTDHFASSLAPFDFDGDGRIDLAIGVAGRQVGGAAGAGEFVVLRNVGGRLSRSGGFVVNRATTGRTPAFADNFAAQLRGGDWSGNGRDDLAVSVPDLTVSGDTDAGAMQVFYGTRSGLGTNDQQFTANALGGTPSAYAYMGGTDL